MMQSQIVKILVFLIYATQIRCEPEVQHNLILEEIRAMQTSHKVNSASVFNKLSTLEYQNTELNEKIDAVFNTVNKLAQKLEVYNNPLQRERRIHWEGVQNFGDLERHQDGSVTLKETDDLNRKLYKLKVDTARSLELLHNLNDKIEKDPINNVNASLIFKEVEHKLDNRNEKLNILMDKLSASTDRIENRIENNNMSIILQTLDTKLKDLVYLEKQHYNHSITLIENYNSSLINEMISSYSSCVEAVKNNGYSGVYSIRDPNQKLSTFKVFCLKDPKGEFAWTVISRRQNDSKEFIDFKRNWEEYKNGFGDTRYDYWLGLKYIFGLTNSTRHEFWVNVIDAEGGTSNSHHDDFSIKDEAGEYSIFSLGKKSEVWSMESCADSPFSTFDRGNMTYVNDFGGAGFWSSCEVNLNSQSYVADKIAIGLAMGEIDVTYIHLAIRPVNE